MQGHHVSLDLGDERVFTNTCVGLCFVTVNGATLDTTVAAYGEIDAFA